MAGQPRSKAGKTHNCKRFGDDARHEALLRHTGGNAAIFMASPFWAVAHGYEKKIYKLTVPEAHLQMTVQRKKKHTPSSDSGHE